MGEFNKPESNCPSFQIRMLIGSSVVFSEGGGGTALLGYLWVMTRTTGYSDVKTQILYAEYVTVVRSEFRDSPWRCPTSSLIPHKGPSWSLWCESPDRGENSVLINIQIQNRNLCPFHIKKQYQWKQEELSGYYWVLTLTGELQVKPLPSIRVSVDASDQTEHSRLFHYT